MGKNLLDLARHVGGTVAGDPSVDISGVGTLDNATEGQITFVANIRYAAKIKETGASAVIIPPEADPAGKNAIIVPNPYLAFAKILALFTARKRSSLGIHPGAFVDDTTVIGVEPSIYPGACIAGGVRIGDRVTIFPHVTIYEGVTIGDDVTLHAGVCIREGCRIGNNVTIHNGSIIGADGFGYAPDGHRWHKIPQVGIVVIENDVEIGANVTIDRAALEVTRIGRGVKIDNLVQIAHNCSIGEDCIITAQAGIAGSTTLGRHVIMGGQAAVADHVTIGDNAMISGQSGVFNNVAPGEVLSGTPAIPHATRLKAAAVYPFLPKMRKELLSLVKRMAKLEEEK